MIFDKFSLNITSFPTITSLTFAIYLCHYLPKATVPMLSGQIAKDIRESYTGGSTDMFLPYSSEKQLPSVSRATLYSAKADDVNSLYPFVMLNNKLPCGKIYYQHKQEGDILKNKQINFIKKGLKGFFYCKVTAPDILKHPIIQLHVNNNNLISTISPLGTFETMIYSEELLNAVKYGYQFEVLRGYYFEKSINIFKDYITELYNMRLEYPKDHPMNFIAKILMNSLYGRFGMNDTFSESSILSISDFNKYMNKLSPIQTKLIEDIDNVGDTHMLISKFIDPQSTLLNSLTESHNVNIAIASAITALARVEMSKYKNNSNFNLFYTDTDSLFIDIAPNEFNSLFSKATPESNLLGDQMGQLKLEHKISKAVFLAPKAYYLEFPDGGKLIKIKGLNSKVVNNSDLDFDKFHSLLQRDFSLLINQDKWFKDFSQGTINVLEQSYQIKHNDLELVIL